MFTKFTTTWYEVYDDENTKMRRFLTQDEAEYFAQPNWTIKKISVEHTPFIPEDAPF
jgi:uncharacterized phage-like protein YoqJ